MSTAKRLVTLLAALVAAGLTTLGLASTAQAAPYVPAPTVSISISTPAVGGSLTITISGFRANITVDITLHTQVYDLGTATTDASGTVNATVTLPPGVSGKHTIVVTDPVTGQTASVPIDIGGSAAAPPGVGLAAAPPGPPAGGGLAFTGVAVAGIGAVGLALLAGGGVLLVIGRRRRSGARS